MSGEGGTRESTEKGWNNRQYPTKGRAGYQSQTVSSLDETTISATVGVHHFLTSNSA